MLVDERIGDILGAYTDPEVTAKALIQAANDAGGQDNITVVVVDLEGAEAAAVRAHDRKTKAWLAVLGWVCAFAVVVGAIGYGVYAYARNSYFVTTESGVVVVYQGVPGELAGQSLRWLVVRTSTPVDALPANAQQRLRTGITVASEQEARALADAYAALAGSSAETSPPVAPDGQDETGDF